MRSHAKASSAASTTRQATGLGRKSVAFVCLLGLLAFCGSSASSALAAVTPKAVTGYFGASGSAGGQLNTPRGVAVNQANGNVYLADSNNHRISVFDSSGTFLRAFGQDVVASGPGDNGTGYEICVAANGDVCKAGITTASTGGAIQAPQGVALDAAGNLYVSESTKIRVQKFDPAGNFLLAFGKDVVEAGPGNTGTGPEVCVAANGDVCKAGVTGSLGGEFKSTFNGQLAVAPAGSPNAGNVLVADPANLRVQEFTSSGAFVRAFGFDVKVGGVTTFEVCEAAAECKIGVSGTGAGQFANSVNRVAEDADGNIYTVESGSPNFRVQKFTLAANVLTPQGTFSAANLKGSAAASAPLDVAIDPATKNVLVTKAFAAGSTPSCPATESPSSTERRIVEVSQAGELEGTHMACAAINIVNGIDVRGSSGDLYVASTSGESRLYVLNTPHPDPSVGFHGISGITAHGATVSGFVNPNGPSAPPYAAGLTTSYHFAYRRSGDSTFSKAPATAVDVGRGTSNLLVSQELPGLEAGTAYEVKLVAQRPFNAGSAETATFTFSTPAAPAEVGVPSATTAATEGGDVRAALWGTVNPNSKETTYRFEYGTTTSYGTKVPAPDASLGSGAATVPVAQFLDGLEPSTTYHFRIVAKNANGAAASPDRTFTTPPLGAELPDNRGAELVTPADKGASGSIADLLSAQQFTQASPDGDSFVFPLQNGLDSSSAGGWLRQRAARTPSGWLSTQISGPSLIQPPRHEFGVASPSTFKFSSPDNSCGLLESYNPLSPDTPRLSVELGVTNLYRWSADGDYDLVSNRLPLNPEYSPQGNIFGKVDAADDCSRVYFETEYELIEEASGLYEWHEGTLRDAGVLPDGEVGADMTTGAGASVGSAVIGGQVDVTGTGRWNAVSPDGSRLFFTAISNGGPDAGRPAVFMREDGGARIVNVSESQTTVPTNGARFEAASADGSRVFFRANYGIAGSSSPGPTDEPCGSLRRIEGSEVIEETAFPSNPTIERKPCDLYAYDVETGQLADLSADANPADPAGAQIQGTVAVDEDGSHLYFAALGQLVPGEGRTYAENTAGFGSANVYLAHEGALSYVATLAQHGPAPGGGQTGDLFGFENNFGAALMRKAKAWVANTSADGGELLFMSSRNLTGYESGGTDKYAAYLYSADTGRLSCVSCRLDGLPSIAKSKDAISNPLNVRAAEASWLLARPDQSYRPRSISEDGSRVFFTSPDPLAPGAVAGKRNVYQWQQGQVRFLALAEPGGVNGLKGYLDASASGEDVFIATAERLAPQDTDFLSDVYDLRVNGGFPWSPEPPDCQVDEAISLLPDQDYCQGTPSPQPPAPGPASAGFQGPGNPPQGKPKRRPCKKGKVGRRGKCVKRQKRGAKHRRGRAANHNRGGAK